MSGMERPRFQGLSLRLRVFAVLLVALVLLQVGSFAIVGAVRGYSARHLANDLIAADVRSVQSRLQALPAGSRDALLPVLERAGYGWRLWPAVQPLPAADSRLLTELAQRVAQEPAPGPVQPVHWDGGEALRLPLDTQQHLLVVFSTGLPQSLPGASAALLYLLAVLFAVAVAAWVAVSVATDPLRRAARAAQGLAQQMGGPPLTETGPPELQALVRNLNALRAEVREQLDARTRILWAVTHDLRTPITRMQLRVEAVSDEALRVRLQADLDAMARLVDEGLTYARSGQLREKPVPVDLNALIENAVEQAQDLGHDCRYTPRQLPPVQASPGAMARLIQNLLDNALRYGGQAEIDVELSGDRVTLRVADRGPGLQAKDLERMFEPFVRGEHSRGRETGGSGLGLAIARNIAQAHGGRLWLQPREGGGLVACLQWPGLAPAVRPVPATPPASSPSSP